MQKNSRSLFLLLCIIFCSCCQTQKSSIDIPTVLIDITQTEQTEHINDFFEFSHYIPLETSKDIMVGEINKLQICNDQIYILDNTTMSIFTFDMSGKLLNQLKKHGRAQGEYLELSDMEITSDGCMYVYDGMSGRLLQYDSQGKFINVKYGLPKGEAIKLLDKNILAINRANGSGTDSQTDCIFNYQCLSDNNILHQSIPYNKGVAGRRLMLGNGKSMFYYYNGQTYLSSQLNDTIYRVSSKTGVLSPIIAFDLQTDRPTEATSEEDAFNYMKDVRMGKQPSMPYCFYKFKNGSMILYNSGGTPRVVIIDDQSNILHSAKISYDSYGLPFSPIPFYDTDNTAYLICLLKPNNLEVFTQLCKKKQKDPKILNELNQKISIDDNPILLFYKWIR